MRFDSDVLLAVVKHQLVFTCFHSWSFPNLGGLQRLHGGLMGMALWPEALRWRHGQQAGQWGITVPG